MDKYIWNISFGNNDEFHATKIKLIAENSSLVYYQGNGMYLWNTRKDMIAKNKQEFLEKLAMMDYLHCDEDNFFTFELYDVDFDELEAAKRDYVIKKNTKKIKGAKRRLKELEKDADKIKAHIAELEAEIEKVYRQRKVPE